MMRRWLLARKYGTSKVLASLHSTRLSYGSVNVSNERVSHLCKFPSAGGAHRNQGPGFTRVERWS